MERKTVMVGGTKVELENRSCKCGCSTKFWVMPTSKQTYARKECKEGIAGMSWLDMHRNKDVQVVFEASDV